MKLNRSVKRLLDILDLISQHEDGLTLGQIYRMLNIPKSTAYDFLQTLYHYDAVYYKDPRLKNYVIGSKMYAIGSVYTNNSKLIEAAERELKIFSNNYGKTTFITKPTDENIVFVFKYQPSNSLIATPEEIGSIISKNSNNPIAKCFNLFNGHNNKFNEEELTMIKKGYVLSDTQTSGHISTIAVPVRNFENKVTGVIAVSDLQTEESIPVEVINEVLRIAQVVSKRLGYLGDGK